MSKATATIIGVVFGQDFLEMLADSDRYEWVEAPAVVWLAGCVEGLDHGPNDYTVPTSWPKGLCVVGGCCGFPGRAIKALEAAGSRVVNLGEIGRASDICNRNDRQWTFDRLANQMVRAGVLRRKD